MPEGTRNPAMSKKSKLLLSISLAAVLVGCGDGGSIKFDNSTHETYEASLEKIDNELRPEKNKEFHDAMAFLITDSVQKAAAKNTEKMAARAREGKGKDTNFINELNQDFNAQFHGKTVDEIIAMAKNARERNAEEKVKENEKVAKFASKFEFDQAAEWSDLTGGEWIKIAGILQSALECTAKIPNTPEIRALLKGEPSTDSNDFSVPVSEEYYKIMSTQNTNVPQNKFGGDLNFIGEIIPANDFRAFGLPVKKIQIGRFVDYHGGYYSIKAEFDLPVEQIIKAAGLKNSDDERKTKAGKLRAYSTTAPGLDGENILACTFWEELYED
jgi:hypothetical protein